LTNLNKQEVAFISDREIGRLVGFSSEWVRQQRYFRRHGKKHSFPLDPIYIGTKPRYRASEVYAWVEALDASHVGADQSPPQTIEQTQ
jgi:predicted DNA-binding transcriptional regulator AlpA